MKTVATAKWATNVDSPTAKPSFVSPPATTWTEAIPRVAVCPEVVQATKVAVCAGVCLAEADSKASLASSRTSEAGLTNTIISVKDLHILNKTVEDIVVPKVCQWANKTTVSRGLFIHR